MFSKADKDKIIKQFAQSEHDTGSQVVQVALLTEHIKQLTEHCKSHPKDFSSRRGLLKMVSNRNGFLKYLKRNNVAQYENLIKQLGIRK